jgi:hypothetical protein
MSKKTFETIGRGTLALIAVLESGAMSYMMSKDAYLTDSDGHNMSHLMFYAPLMDGGAWGDLPGSPVMLNLQFHGAPEPITVFMVPVGKCLMAQLPRWSRAE